jgi:hypothetical protein
MSVLKKVGNVYKIGEKEIFSEEVDNYFGKSKLYKYKG